MNPKAPACISFIAGVIFDDGIVSGPHGALALSAVRDALGALRARLGQLPMVVVVTDAEERERLPEAQLVAAEAAVTSASDMLIVVSGPTTSARVMGLADRRRYGARRDDADDHRLLSPLDIAPLWSIELADDGSVASAPVYPRRYSADTRSEAAFWESVASRSRLAKDLRRFGDASRDCAELHVRTDLLANRLQRQAEWGRAVLYTLGFVALTVHAFGAGPTAVMLQYGFIALAIGAFLYVRAAAFQSRHQDYRALSEALRVRAVWASFQIDAPLEDGYLVMQQTELAWIREALRVAAFVGGNGAARTPDDRARSAVTAWVRDQRGYYLERSRAMAVRRKRFSVAVEILAPLGLVAGATAFVLEAAGALTPAVGASLGKLAVWAAGTALIVRELARNRGFAEHANRYQRMYFVFDRALQVLETDKRPDLARRVAAALGRDALTEHADWLLAQRDRPIALPPASTG